ncbi:MAG: DNA polymerase I [Bacteroidales bacterium]|nr:DNA polymerase I [Bacteroidales bacterium]
MERKLLLIDGHSLIFRMYYAFLRHPMINSKGTDVSILFGFTKYVLELIEKEKPTHVAVCFDPPGKTFRHALYPEYKGTRDATPELVIEALEPLIRICKALEIPVLMVPGFEGDDVLGSMAVRSAGEGFKVYMVTPDKDFGQLIGDNIFQYKPGKGGADNEIVGPAQLCEKLGIQYPSQVIDMLTLCGDASDNVPGVKGVGEVGASKLIARYGTVGNIYAHLDELSEKQAEMFRQAQDHIDLSKTLVTIKTDIPLDVTADDMLLRTEHKAEVAELFDFYEFSSLMKYVHLAPGQEVRRQSPSVAIEWMEVSPKQLCDKAAECGVCALVVEPDGDGVFAGIRGITAAVAAGGTNYASFGSAGDFRDMLSDGGITKTGYALKSADSLLDNAGIKLGGKLEDIELMHYLVDPEKTHKIEVLSRSYLSYNMEEEVPAADREDEINLFNFIDDAPVAAAPKYKEAVVSALLDAALRDELANMALDKLYFQIEEPLIRVLARMERNGVRVDLNILKDYAQGLAEDLVAIEAKVRESIGLPELNVGSPKQVGLALFETLRIDPRVKGKKDARNTYLTDEETLMNYAEEFPVIYDILDYRAVKKLLGTYIEPFASWVSPRDGRVHTTFNQALTATGRLSSSKPNLQNIPIRTERGREIRKAFVASEPGNVIVSADYSQIELRLMAHFCGDDHLCDAFCHGQDVHAITASKIFGVPVSEVTPEQRRMAKTANFGIMYGISAFGLAQRLHIPRVAAKKLIEDYFASFPSIRQWIEKTKADASGCGYVQTLFGRRRYLPEINSRNAATRALAERNAVNAPIQGTAADIIKIAMNRVDLRLRNGALRSRMVLQIHDELLFEAPESEVEELMEIIRQEMENVITLSVPLTVECNYGKNWLEAH